MSVKVLSFFILEGLYFCVCHSNLEYHPEESLTTVIFKVIPILYLVFLVATTRTLDGEHGRYKKEVLVALVFSFLGDVCLVWRHTLFAPGAVFFAIAHFFYIRAFRLRPIEYESAFIVYLSMVVVFMFFYPGLTLKTDVALLGSYFILIFTMWWRSIVYWQKQPTLSSLLASFGAFVFCVSDFCLALDKWRMELPFCAPIVMTLYYLAQFLFAMSVYSHIPPGFEDMELRAKKQG